MTAHVHAANIALFAQDAAETGSPWLRWEISTNGVRWQDLNHMPIWDTSYYYRRKRPMRAINGIEFPYPLSPSDKTTPKYVWYPHPASEERAYMILAESANGQSLINRHLAHRTQEDAAAHAEAMLSIATGF